MPTLWKELRGEGAKAGERSVAGVGWKEVDLARRPKRAQKKVQIALQLQEQTVMTMEWIAKHLQLGTRTYLNHLLYWHRRGK
jgi:hypothetical protein